MSRTLFHSRTLLSATVFVAALLGTACSDSTAPSNTASGSHDGTPEAQVPGATASSAETSDSAAPTVSQLVVSAPTGKTRCQVFSFTSSGSRTYYGKVYASTAGSVLQYYVKVTNYNILGWSGTVFLDGFATPLFLLPYQSKWVGGPAIFLSRYQRAWQYKLGVSPNSDASVIGLQVYAPKCS